MQVKKQYKDIKDYDSFSIYGDTLTKVYADDVRHIYAFKRTQGEYYFYELVIGVKTVNDDGSTVYRYPNNTEWGTKGFTIIGSDKDEMLKKHIKELEELIDSKDSSRTCA